MKFYSVRDLRSKSSEIWGLLREEGDLVITSNGKPIALLTDVEGKDLEEYLRSSRRLRASAAVNRLQEEASKQGLDQLADEDIEAEIQASRRNRKR